MENNYDYEYEMCPILMHAWLSRNGDISTDNSNISRASMLKSCKCGSFCKWYDEFTEDCRLINALERNTNKP